MTQPTALSRRTLLRVAGMAVGAPLLGACGGDGSPPGGTSTAAIDWWTIQTTDPLKPFWAELAADYQLAHRGVSIAITPLENEAFKSKLTTAANTRAMPDLFQSWGGGVLKQQVDAGLVRDITDDVAPWLADLTPVAVRPYQIDGRTYGIPWTSGMVGFWYNKDLFARAGISASPATWGELLDDVRRLKAAGVTPIALGGKDKWPAHFYWTYLCMRVGGLDALARATESRSFSGPEFVTAGALFKELIDLEPFQSGFLSAEYMTPGGQAAAVGNGAAALELMGQWAPAAHAEWAANKKGLGDKLGFFPFPAVDGGKGSATDVLGGGNGFAVGKDAPPETVDLLRFLLTTENQRKAAATGAVMPTNRGAADAITDPNLAAVARSLSASTGFQLYLDQAFPPAIGRQVNDSVAELVAGTATPEQVTKDVTSVARAQ